MLKTKIIWTVHSYCKSRCSYCPSHNWNGEEPADIEKYLQFIKYVNEHYDKMGRIIDWYFDGGEPLDFFDFNKILKECKKENNKIKVNTNGGSLWMDWWVLEPYIDKLNLSYHYWQNPSLINFIIEIFLEKKKNINLIVPIRAKYFQNDYNRAINLENNYSIKINKQFLNDEDYSDDQKLILLGKERFENLKKSVVKFWGTHKEEFLENFPIQTGKKCNEGIEILKISGGGWTGGGDCRNTSFGNIWFENFKLPDQPQICKMMACIEPDDQWITKFTD
jgi:organic radical activating enzyme